MHRLFWILLPLFAPLLCPTDAWEASVSQNLAITITTTNPGFYVALNGSDSNPGTLSQPFGTLGKCQTAMRASSTKTCYIRAGTYTPSASGNSCVFAYNASINLTSSDNGETWSYYPPDGVGTAIIDGQSTTGGSGTVGNGTVCAFSIIGASNITITGLTIRRYGLSGVWTDVSTNITVSNNTVSNTTSAVYTNGAIAFVNSPGSVADHNYVHDITFMGIGAWSDTNTAARGLNNVHITNNYIQNVCTRAAVPGGNDQNGGDCGGIYFIERNAAEGALSTGIQVTNNYVRDINISSNGAGDFNGTCCASGIYMDEGSSNITFTENVVAGVMSNCFFINGGNNNVMTGNICDLDNSGVQTIVEYDNPGNNFAMTGNVFQKNIVTADSSGGGRGYFGGNHAAANPMSISQNFYHNYVGASVRTTANGNNASGSDISPVTGNPQISCWAATIAGGSPVFSAPPTGISFPGITGGWGPPGFAIPQTGTAPSWPHNC